MKKIVPVLLAAAVLLVALPSCQPAYGQEVKSNARRVTVPEVSQVELATLVGGNNQFAFDLFQVLREGDGNLFYSPYSLSVALAMTYAGACGETEKAMAEALNFTLSQDKLHPAFNSLGLQLQQRENKTNILQRLFTDDVKGFHLDIANAIWGQEGWSFLQSYLDTLAQNYGAGMRLLDFQDTEKSREIINDWVSDSTAGKITGLIEEGKLDPAAVLVLTNAIYFNAMWANPFDKGKTKDGTFHTLKEGDVTVPLMHRLTGFKYSEGDNYQAIELPYDGGELSMVVILPEAGQYSEFERSLNANMVNEIFSNMKSDAVNLTIPKFEFESSFALKEALTQLGMGVAFGRTADFSGVDGTHSLWLDDVVHKSFVTIGENGTEAASASAVYLISGQGPSMCIDHPFIFLIRDIQTNSIIFIGRVLNPAA